MSRKLKRCTLCDRTESTHHISEAGVCATCDVSLIYWRKRTTTQIVKRARQIQSFTNRMELLLGNVKSMPGRKKKGSKKKASRRGRSRLRRVA